MGYKSIVRKMKRALASTTPRKRARLARLRRFKKVGYKSNRLKRRFTLGRLRARRSNMKLRLHAHLRSTLNTSNYTMRLRTRVPFYVPNSYKTLLKARGVRRPLKNYLTKPVGWPYVQFRLTPLRKYRRLRKRGRRYRKLFQKNFTIRSRPLIKSGWLVRITR